MWEGQASSDTEEFIAPQMNWHGMWRDDESLTDIEQNFQEVSSDLDAEELSEISDISSDFEFDPPPPIPDSVHSSDSSHG